MLTLSTPGAPEWSAAKMRKTALDARHLYLSSALAAPGWASPILALFAGERRAPEITRIDIKPADVTVMQGETVNFAAAAFSSDARVAAVSYRWSFAKDGEEGVVRGFNNGAFKATRPGRYVVTAAGEGAQGRTTVTVLPNEGHGIQKRLQTPDGDRSEKDRQILQQMARTGALITRSISSRDGYTAEAERQRAIEDEGKRQGVRQKQAELRQRRPDPLAQSAVERTEAHLPSEDSVAQTGRRKGGPRVDDEPGTAELPAAAAPAPRLMDTVEWDDGNWWTADDPVNEVGNPPGTAPDAGASNGNFRLTAPVLSLAGRGLDVDLALTYNSRLWSKSGTTMTYDADDGFPGPGWNIGFGKMIYTGANGGCMLITADGTRRSHTGTNNTYGSGTYYSNYYVGKATDGSLIDYSCYYSNSTYGTSLTGTATMANGTTIQYSSATADYKQVFPTRITDTQGNYITITYVNNRGPRIDTITDTLDRDITFNYDSSERLINITGPGYNGATRTFVRLVYAQKTLGHAFASGYTAYAASSAPYQVEAIYYPETNTGYWFGDTNSYSSYGMIAKVESQRGMGWSGSAGTQGAATEGTVNRAEVYDFDMTASSTLTDAPGYTTHTETWDRMGTTPTAVTSYGVSTASGTEVITVTRPDGSISKQSSVSNPSNWDDGLFFQNEILEPSPSTKVLSKTKMYLASGAYGSSRPTKIENTDELNQTTKTEFTYGTSYNQVTVQKEFDYSGALYRENRYTYENASQYVNRHIFSLVKKQEQYDASNNRLAVTEYQYDNNAVVNGTSSHNLVTAPGVVMHNESSDPHTTDTQWVNGACMYYGNWNYYPQCQFEGQEVWGWVGSEYEIIDYCHGQCEQYEQVQESAYDPSSIFRGNVTRVTTYADAAPSNPTGAVMYDYTYDVTGNRRTATTNCCEQMSFNYADSYSDQIERYTYAHPTSVTKGSPDPQSAHRVTTSATYDFNTGAMRSSTDANGRTTTVAYDAAARPTLVTAPTLAKTTTNYDDANWKPIEMVLLADDTTVVSKTQTELNGRGQPVASGYFVDATVQNKTVIEYDNMGRRKKVFTPYASNQTASTFATVYTYDHLSRVTQVTAPDLSTSKTFYNEDPGMVARPDSANPASTHKGQTMRSQDAWGRERWARTDAFGRLAEVVEPNPAGNGAVGATGSLMTSYSYNQSDELTLITQGGQTRSFKYDSLGRMTRQKLAEQTAKIKEDGTHVGPSGTGAVWSDAFKYDSKSNLTERLDARGVKTVFDYGSDPLNRLQGITYDKTAADTTYTIHAAPSVSIEYMTTGDKSRVKKVTTAGVATEENTYDAEGRVTDYTLTFANRTGHPMMTSYDYDTASRLTEVLYPKQYGMTDEPQKEITPTYDQASRLTALQVGTLAHMSGVEYNARGQVTQLTVTDGADSIIESYGYDAETGLLTSQYAYQTDVFREILSLGYGYSRGGGAGSLGGKTGQLTQVVNLLDRNKDRNYEHDALGRLTSAKGGLSAGATGVTANWTQSYSYDRYGNKTGTAKTGVTSDNQPVPLDGLPSVTYNAASNRMDATGWEYDLSGNLTRGQNADGVWQKFEYDAAGRLVVIKNDSNNVLEEYKYGASRNRLIKQDATERTYYAWGEQAVICEYKEPVTSSTPAYAKSYVYAGIRLVSTSTKTSSTAETTRLHHPDRLGTGAISAPAIDEYAEHSTLPFGTALGWWETSSATNQTFTSYDRSSGTGLDYAVNRTYSSGQGRFAQADPIGMAAASPGNPQSNNLYAYVQNSPTDSIDPSGLICITYYRGIPMWWGNDRSELPPDEEGLTMTRCDSSRDGGEGGGGGGGGGGPAAPPTPAPDKEKCLAKLNDVLKTLLGEKAFNKLADTKSGQIGFEALGAWYLNNNRIVEDPSGKTLSKYDPDTGIITINTNPLRTEWGIRLDFIHETLHGAKSSAFSHRDIYEAMTKVDKLDFEKFSADRKKDLKARKQKVNDDSMYRDGMNAWIRQYCEK
jgi:RHS repeat-associated protein